MPISQPDLWQRIGAYPLGSAGAGDLAERVQRGSSPDRAKADAVIAEYRRFLYLAATAGETVAPSPLLDRAWHKHIEDARDYVDGFCLSVVGRILHQSPGRAPARDDPAHARTLELYRRAFDSEPPHRVWPRPAVMHWRQAVGFFFVAGLAPALIGAVSGVGLLILPGIALALGPLAWRLVVGPWPTGNLASGGCGGDQGAA